MLYKNILIVVIYLTLGIFPIPNYTEEDGFICVMPIKKSINI